MFLVALTVVRIVVAAKGEERWDHLNSLCTYISGTGIKQGCRWCYITPNAVQMNMQGIEKAPPTMAVSSSPLTAEDGSAVELSEIYRESEAEIPHLETATAGAMEEHSHQQVES